MTRVQPRKSSSLADALANPAGVVRLSVIGTPIPALPDDIRTLANLEVLTLNGNGLEVLPDALFELPQLRVLNLFNNVPDRTAGRTGEPDARRQPTVQASR